MSALKSIGKESYSISKEPDSECIISPEPSDRRSKIQHSGSWQSSAGIRSLEDLCVAGHNTRRAAWRENMD